MNASFRPPVTMRQNAAVDRGGSPNPSAPRKAGLCPAESKVRLGYKR